MFNAHVDVIIGHNGVTVVVNSPWFLAVDVHIEHQGIRILTNPDAKEDKGQPNFLLNAFSDLFNNINNVREDITQDIEKGGRKIQAINKVLLRKLRN